MTPFSLNISSSGDNIRAEINMGCIEHITVNIAGSVRRERMHDRDVIVVPMTLMVEGILAGNEGPLFYPLKEIKKSVNLWNGMPIVVNHPQSSDGIHISARNPKVNAESTIGTVYNVRMEDGKLKAEGWIDVVLAQKVDARILANINSNIPIELSTGLFTDIKRLPGEFNNTTYVSVATNYRPDHLAILPDQEGACSIADGCGVLVNKRFSLENVVMALSKKKREEFVGYLIQNCDCWEEEDKEILDAMPDAKLSKLVDNTTSALRNVAIANNVMELDGVTLDEKTLELSVEIPEPPEPMPLTNEQWMDAAPPEIKEMINKAQLREHEERAGYIEAITANESNMFTEDQLNDFSTEQLQGIAKVAEVKKKTSQVTNFKGAATPAPTPPKSSELEAPLPHPVMEFRDEAIEKAIGM